MCVRYVNFFHVCRFSDSSREHHTPTIFSTLSLSTRPLAFSWHALSAFIPFFLLSAFECEKRFRADDIGAALGVGKRGWGWCIFLFDRFQLWPHYHLPEPLFCAAKSIAPLFYSRTASSATVGGSRSASLVFPLCAPKLETRRDASL